MVLIALLLGLSLTAVPPTAAQTDAATVTGSAILVPDQPVAGMKVDLFNAADPWNRASYIGSAFTDDEGTFSFSVEPLACYIVVAISPLGLSFDSPDSGTVYDQQYGCVSDLASFVYTGTLYGEGGPEEPPVEEEDGLINGNVTFDDDEPAAGVKATIFEAVSPWDRGLFLGDTFSSISGEYSFPVETGCYIVVVIAELGSSFGSVGSGNVYEQLYVCVDGNGTQPTLDSVLYREIN